MFDVLIIGAGQAGLIAAKTIIECEGQHVNLKIIDGNKTVGGLWAKENLFPGLKTNNKRGGLDFSDLVMDDSFGVPDKSPMTGDSMYAFLDHYAKKWDITRRVEFQTYVKEISRLDYNTGWNVSVRRSDDTEDNYSTAKLIVATGITNTPHYPHLPDTSSYGSPIIHSANLGKQTDTILSKSVQTVTVIGGAKSAYDAVYLAASSGKKVHWIIRKSGKGPGWVFPPLASLGPFKAWRERLVTRRFISCLSPWIWDDGMGRLRSFLHESWLGKKVTQAFWGDIHHVTIKDCKYQDEECLKILEPEQSPFWYGTTTGVYNYPQPDDLYHYIRTNQVIIHRADITGFSPSTIHLSTSASVPSDLLIAATGFSPQPTIKFHPSVSHAGLGLPSNNLTTSQKQFWSNLTDEATSRIGEQFPRLVKGPFQSPTSDIVQPFKSEDDLNATYTPWRLYRGMAPPGPTADGLHDLIFLGMLLHLSNTVKLEIQCLWAWAYLTGQLASLKEVQAGDTTKQHHLHSSSSITTRSMTSKETTPLLEKSLSNNDPALEKLSPAAKEIYRETALWTRYWHLRAPYGHGRYHPDAVFDQVPLWDLWMKDLGLRTWRKGGSNENGWGWNPKNWFRELFEPYTIVDYRGIVSEWLSLHGRR